MQNEHAHNEEAKKPTLELPKDVDVEALVKSLPTPTLAGHTWKQYGTEVRCDSCPFPHSTIIPVGYQLYGVKEDGTPMFRAVVVH